MEVVDELIPAFDVSDGILDGIVDNESITGTDTSHYVTTNQVLIGSIVNIHSDQVDESDKIVNSNADASQEHSNDRHRDELSKSGIECTSTTEFVLKETSTSSPRDHAEVSSQSSTQSKSNNNPTESANEADIGLQEDVCSSHLVVLLSNGVANSTQAVNQTRALKLLDDLQLPYQVVDGMDSHQLKKRDELFSISGIRGNYPQIFISEVGQQRYLGGYDWFAETIADITGSAQGTALLSAVGRKEEYFQMISQSIDHVKVCMIVLISNGVADYLQKANQKSAIQLLTDLNIRHRIVDGMDSNQADERNELFKISGIRGQYPQLFASDENSNQTRYLGGYDWLESQSPMDLATSLE
jgi:glutaredoxin